MFKLLIVDDEPLVCVGLQSMLKWDDYGIEVVGTARNGQQAAEMISSLLPHIVISDIKMPIKTGLDLAQECQEQYGSIPLFIFLTSYEEFSLVHKAIQLRAVDYLIKLDLTKNKLEAAIEKALALLSEFESSANAMERSMQARRDKFFLLLHNNMLKDDELYRQQRDELEIDFSLPLYCAGICEMTFPKANEMEHDKLVALYESTTRMLAEALRKSFTVYITPLGMQQSILTFCINSPDDFEGVNGLIEVLNKAIAMTYSYFSVSVHIAVGTLVDDPQRLHESYATAQQLMVKATSQQPLQLNLGEYKDNLKHKVIDDIKTYINENLGSRLSLNEIAAKFNFSPSYLSQIFAKYSDEGFIEYITNARIESAKEMLEQGGVMVYEIAEQLGFENAFYFSKVFKKNVGVSPREYARNLQKLQQ